MKILNDKNFTLKSLDWGDLWICKSKNQPVVEEFFEKHCSNLKELTLESLDDGDFENETFTNLITRMVL